MARTPGAKEHDPTVWARICELHSFGWGYKRIHKQHLLFLFQLSAIQSSWNLPASISTHFMYTVLRKRWMVVSICNPKGCIFQCHPTVVNLRQLGAVGMDFGPTLHSGYTLLPISQTERVCMNKRGENRGSTGAEKTARGHNHYLAPIQQHSLSLVSEVNSTQQTKIQC